MTLEFIKQILADNNPEQIETLAQKAACLTRQNFGRTISLYAPLYLSNFCASHCIYCGFSIHNKIHRMKLTPSQMQQEMERIASTGIENILLLTGESCHATPLSYLKEAVTTAKQFFSFIALEVYPMETDQYRELFRAGVDGVTVYQETYNRQRYQDVHRSGIKSDFEYRRATPARIAQSGIRQISLGILLGLSDAAEDVFELFRHLKEMEKNYPGIEYSLSFPRLRKIKGQDFVHCNVNDITFIKIICLARILFPRVGISLTTRENQSIRNHAIEMGITKISAGSNTAVGGYSIASAEDQDPQFDIEDKRSVKETINYLKSKNFDPVLTDWRRITVEEI